MFIIVYAYVSPDGFLVRQLLSPDCLGGPNPAVSLSISILHFSPTSRNFLSWAGTVLGYNSPSFLCGCGETRDSILAHETRGFQECSFQGDIVPGFTFCPSPFRLLPDRGCHFENKRTDIHRLRWWTEKL